MYDYYLKTQRDCTHFSNLRFESRVILDGSQTSPPFPGHRFSFESRVILDGSQTWVVQQQSAIWFESRVTLVKAQAEANASACFFINSVYVKNPSCFPMKTGRVVANLLFVDTIHHTFQAWCIFATFVLTPRDNEDKRDKMRRASQEPSFHRTFFCQLEVPSQQILSGMSLETTPNKRAKTHACVF